ncbi:M48 family metalloprotease [Paracoccus endophyticus]|uniref:M48 family metalloprotease n=1 Tax=Paracoccus endophyticus TaxID=2233774 RepID=UPI000DD5511E|nr:M48 family metalloprotease [Paracoccus endophyticus]
MRDSQGRKTPDAATAPLFGTGLRGLALAAVVALSGCAVQVGPAAQAPVEPIILGVPLPKPAPTTPNTARESAMAFAQVIRTLEPAIERECVQRRQTPINCDFQFVVDDRVGLEPNAFQTIDSAGRPIIGFTLALLAASRNADELAFVVGHEASHHILGHIDQKASAASAGAVILSGIAAASGADLGAIRSAQQLGAQMGARYYSKDWELEADYLGAIVALNAGFDPENGALFFARIPDPGDRVLGTHPSRAQRQAVVSRAVSDVRSGRAG